MDTQKSLTKQNNITVLEDHKRMLEDTLQHITDVTTKKDKDRDDDKIANKKKDLQEQIKAVDKQISAAKGTQTETKKAEHTE